MVRDLVKDRNYQSAAQLASALMRSAPSNDVAKKRSAGLVAIGVYVKGECPLAKDVTFAGGAL